MRTLLIVMVGVLVQIPVVVAAIGTDTQPVKVGLADAFVVLHELEQIPGG